MKIAWLGADTSLETPVGNNLIRRSEKFKGDTIAWQEIFDNVDLLKDYDLIGVWCGVQNYGVMGLLPRIRHATDGKIITNLWAPGSSEPAWSWNHQVLLMKNTKYFDALISSHKCHLQQYKSLGVPTFYLPHPIDLSKYSTYKRDNPPEEPTVLMGSGGNCSGRGFFYSVVVFKKLQEHFPSLKGVCIAGKENIHETLSIINGVGLNHVNVYEGAPWPEYIKFISENITFQILMFTYSGFDRTTMDCAAVGIPVITPYNLFSGEELFPSLHVSGYWATEEAFERAYRLLTDLEFYNMNVSFGRTNIKRHDITCVEHDFQNILKSIGL